ncbi:thioesterase family protein [Amycolatopsis sp. GM8]|uniref:acyl-CoA thioesterase n=1 Tax=Amycolatopsis sp. GM8 TaxID=2896530 RepID=UPI001F35FA69|nr:thioesterase family protein [Amycolatopsis sp. GM8]
MTSVRDPRPDDIPTRDAFPILYPTPTRWADNDVYGHLNNVVYYSLFDSAVNGWLIKATGTDTRLLPAIGVVVESSCRFLAQISFPDQVHIGIRLAHRGNSSVVYQVAAFVQDETGEIESGPRALGRFVHVYVDAVTRRPTAIPDVVSDALQRHLS